jgi:glyoxylate/hydroxypyruvate reductase
MQRFSQLSSQIAPVIARSSASKAAPTPHLAEDGEMTTSDMAKTKVVVTRQLIDEAQELLDAKKDELDIVQWKSEKVGIQLQASQA